jgi:hypothetical protein
MPNNPSLSLAIDALELKPLIAEIVAEVLTLAHPENGKLCFSEQEAADKLGLKIHTLRDARRRGEIGASVVCGRRIRYTPEDLQDYLNRRRYARK